MATQTSHYNLVKPDATDLIDISVINSDLEIIDGAIHEAKESGGSATDMIADPYSSSATYSVGDYCSHEGKLYRCTTAISTAEDWTAAHWTETTVEQEVEAGQELKDMDLSSYLAEGGSFGELSVKQGEEQLAQATLSGTKLNLKMKEELSRRNVVIEIPVTACTNYNDYTLTITLFPKRDHSPLDPVPAYLNSATELYLVKGQKFTLPEKEWTIPAKADKSVVSVNNKGLLKAKKPGTATIQNKEGSRTIKITVTQPSIAKKLKLEVGGADTPIEQNYDQDYLDAYWISSNLDVATVDQNGKVHAVAKEIGRAHV